MRKFLFYITIIVFAGIFIISLVRNDVKEVSAQSNSCINSRFFTSDKFNFNGFNQEFPPCANTPRCFKRFNSEANEFEYCTPSNPHMASSESFANSRAEDKDECVQLISQYISDVNIKNDFLNAASDISDWGGFYMEVTTSGGNETRDITKCDPNETTSDSGVQCLNNYFSNNNFNYLSYVSNHGRCGVTPQCFTTKEGDLYKFCQTNGVFEELTDMTRADLDNFRDDCTSKLLPYFTSDTIANNFILDFENESNWKGFPFENQATISQCNTIDLSSVQLREEMNGCDTRYKSFNLINRRNYDDIVNSNHGGCSIQRYEGSSYELLPACHTDTINGEQYYCPDETSPRGADAVLLSDYQNNTSVENQALEAQGCLALLESKGLDVGTTPPINSLCPWQGINYDVASTQLIPRDQIVIDFAEDEYSVGEDDLGFNVSLLISPTPIGRSISIDLELKKDDEIIDTSSVIWEDGTQDATKSVGLSLPANKKVGDEFSLNLVNPRVDNATETSIDHKVLASSTILGIETNRGQVISQLVVGDINVKRTLIKVKVINARIEGCALEDDGQPNASCQKCIDQGGVWLAIGCVDPTPLGIMTRIIQTGIGVMGGVALVQLIIVGLYLQSGQEAKIAEARKKLIATLTGIVVLVFSVLILRIIGVNVLDAVPGGFL